VGLRAGYERGEHWSVYIDARNLADEQYIASSSVVAVANPASALFEPGDGIAVFAGINVAFSR
jgi:iron complex outermembrane receptor protein